MMQTLLFLNSIGTLEVIFILLAVLMLFGSKSIPGLAKGLGKGIREVRDASNEIKRDIQNSALEMRNDIDIEGGISEIENYDMDDGSDDHLKDENESDDSMAEKDSENSTQADTSEMNDELNEKRGEA